MVWRFYILSILWAIVTTILILLPGSTMPDTGGLLAFDKVAHTIVFAILSLLAIVGSTKHKIAHSLRTNTIFYALGSCISYGIMLELIQALIPDREFDLLDIVANISGVFVGAFVFYIIYKL